ncbi:hypothetical protein [Mesorhizobium sp. M0977]|uniref:GAP1-N1 domain-containing protein n=1 Tax=Mesorhizobium sp. M0977 TaxID=2957039 RepID=UPI00333A6E8C
MTVVERQVHGYRQGHQLLAASLRLSKEEQSIIDRLSDVSGPLRPRERFEPYLTAYPLPGGDRYVLARTWQDLTVARAGCVRTLSLIIPAAEWGAAENLSPFLDLMEIDRLPGDGDATRAPVSLSASAPLPPASEFRGDELLEALFLEEPRPVVVFNVPHADMVAIRLLTALWPSMRRNFALCTFALSPRKLRGRDFDLVFAPKDARAKFTDWSGRRVDGGLTRTARHRWTGAIVSRVFESPYPRLLSSQEVGLVGGDDVDNGASLRIALLWDELLAKLNTTPTAVLGLLDIANSGKVRDVAALQALEPSLSDAVMRASQTLPDAEAWDFLSAMARKIQGRPMPHGASAVADAVERLAGRAPEGAIALLSQPETGSVVDGLLPRMAEGIGEFFSERAARALLSAEPELLGRLVVEGKTLAQRVAGDDPLVARLGEVLPQLDSTLLAAVAEKLLPHLVENWQLPAAEPLVMQLDGPQLAAEVRHLGGANDFEASRIAEVAVRRARAVGAKDNVRSELADMRRSSRRDAMLALTLDPSGDDVAWLLNDPRLAGNVSTHLLVELLRNADDRQLSSVIGEARIGSEIVRLLEVDAPDIVHRIVFVDGIPLDIFIRAVNVAFAKADADTKAQIAERALRRCLGSGFDGDEVSFLTAMLDAMGERLDGALASRLGLSPNVGGHTASRNMIAFRNAAQPARLRIVWSIAEVARVLRSRQGFDLDAAAADACAQFLYDAEKVTPGSAVAAAGNLVPMLLRQGQDPVSPMIAAAFPMVYRELAKEDDVPDLLKFFPFFDWDRCKVARKELVSAFMSSKWAPGDFALTAWRCRDVGRILRTAEKAYGGEAYLSRVAADLSRLPESCRKDVEKAISTMTS